MFVLPSKDRQKMNGSKSHRTSTGQPPEPPERMQVMFKQPMPAAHATTDNARARHTFLEENK
jgi:hypothetical protein